MLFPSKQSGFSVLEMVVVTAIFVMVTGVVLSNLPSFRNRASLDLTAQEMALAVREAQVYGIATRVVSVGSNEYPSYGIHFEITDEPAGKFTMFADNSAIEDGNKLYDPGDGCNARGINTECLEEFFLEGQFKILKICIDSGNSATSDKCYDQDVAVDVVYTRPFPEPSICFSAGGSPATCEHINAIVTLGSVGGSETRDVFVWNNGQIAAVGNGNNNND